MPVEEDGKSGFQSQKKTEPRWHHHSAINPTGSSYTLPLGIEPLTKAMTSGHDCHISCQVKTPNSASAQIYGWMTHVLCSLLQKQLLQPLKVSCNRKFTSGGSFMPHLLSPSYKPSLPLSNMFPTTSKLPSTLAPLNRLNLRFFFAILSPLAFSLLPTSIFVLCKEQIHSWHSMKPSVHAHR